MLVMGFLEEPDGLLNELAQISEYFDPQNSLQGLDERINRYSVAFLKKYWLCDGQVPAGVPAGTCHSALIQPIHIVDSSFLQLPAAMQAEYPGAGEKGSPASLKI